MLAGRAACLHWRSSRSRRQHRRPVIAQPKAYRNGSESNPLAMFVPGTAAACERRRARGGCRRRRAGFPAGRGPASRQRCHRHGAGARSGVAAVHRSPTVPARPRPAPAGRVTVGVRCGDGQTRYLQARVTAIGQYWVAARDIPVGTLVTASMLEARSGDLATLPRLAVLDENAAVGRMATRTLARGSVIQGSQLQAPALIQRNRTVSVEAVGQGFRVVRQGEALQDGALGDTVRVRMSNRSILTGVVAGDGVVKVSF